MEAKLQPLLKAASETFDKEFKTPNALAKFLSKSNGKKTSRAKRSKPLTEDQKTILDQGRRENKTHAEMAKEAKCSKGQVAKYFSK